MFSSEKNDLRQKTNSLFRLLVSQILRCFVYIYNKGFLVVAYSHKYDIMMHGLNERSRVIDGIRTQELPLGRHPDSNEWECNGTFLLSAEQTILTAS